MKDHLVQLDESWDVWRWTLLRSAGFPAALVLRLSAAGAAAAADRLLAAEEEDPALEEAFRQSFQEALEQQSRKLFEVASGDRFREAVVWQNRDAFHNAVDKLTQHPPGESPRNRQRRKWEYLVANYLQRYCLKNETIGFFGPGCWARFEDQDEILRAEPGPELLSSRRTYFEGWGIDALIETLFEELGPGMKPWLRPRRDPFLLIQGTTVHRMGGAAVQVRGTALRILRAVDGKATARELATRFASEIAASEGADSEGGEAIPEGVYKILEQLVEQGLLVWRLEVPLTMTPGEDLREELERIGDPSVRRIALGKLEEMEAGRAAVAEAAGDSRALNRALEDLGGTFTRLTGQGARRARGRTFAVGPSRALVFEDSHRDLACSLGPEFIEHLAPSLSIILTGARWLSSTLGTRVRYLFQQTMTRLSAELGAPAVPLALLCQHAIPQISTQGREVAAEFQGRWQRLLPVDPTLRVATFSSDEVRSRAEELFQATEPGWRNARHHSPDVMVAAESVEALQRGDFHFVLGEVHSAVNTLENAAAMALHPYPEQLQRAIDLDLDCPGVHMALPRFWQGNLDLGLPIPKTNTRSHSRLFPTEDHILELTASSCGVPPEKSLPFGSAVVVERDGALVVPSLDGTRVFDLLDVLALPLRQIATDIFKLTPPGRHVPRVTLDKLTIQRESWTFPVAEIPFLKLSNEQDRFLAVRRWARRHDLPNVTFFKSPLEVKPVFLNFQSPISIEIFVKTIRRLARRGSDRFSFAVSEMLPAPEEIWLTDAEGQLYTSELRLVAVDRKRGTR